MNKSIPHLFVKWVLYFAWIVALSATILSLYASEILHFLPCILCWYQRICMYPLVIILTTGIVRKDKNIPYYVLPLSIIGMCIAVYHNLLYFKVIPEAIAPCTVGVPCTTAYINYFGFITIPFLSFLSFFIITICMFVLLRYNRKK